MSATGIPTPIPILADVGKLFTCGAVLGIGAGTGADEGVVVGVLVRTELEATKDEKLAVDAELKHLNCCHEVVPHLVPMRNESGLTVELDFLHVLPLGKVIQGIEPFITLFVKMSGIAAGGYFIEASIL